MEQMVSFDRQALNLVRYDVSEAHKVMECCEIDASFGLNIITKKI